MDQKLWASIPTLVTQQLYPISRPMASLQTQTFVAHTQALVLAQSRRRLDGAFIIIIFPTSLTDAATQQRRQLQRVFIHCVFCWILLNSLSVVCIPASRTFFTLNLLSSIGLKFVCEEIYPVPCHPPFAFAVVTNSIIVQIYTYNRMKQKYR